VGQRGQDARGRDCAAVEFESGGDGSRILLTTRASGTSGRAPSTARRGSTCCATGSTRCWRGPNRAPAHLRPICGRRSRVPVRRVRHRPGRAGRPARHRYADPAVVRGAARAAGRARLEPDHQEDEPVVAGTSSATSTPPVTSRSAGRSGWTRTISPVHRERRRPVGGRRVRRRATRTVRVGHRPVLPERLRRRPLVVAVGVLGRHGRLARFARPR